MTIGRHQCQWYDIDVAGRRFRFAGPATPDDLLSDPEVERRFERDEYMPYWATPWPAAALLAGHLAAQPVRAGAATLELGAGLGIVSVVAAAFGHRMIATDYDDDALDFVRENARVNQVTLDGVQRLDWRSPPPLHHERIVAADVLYEDRHLATIADLLAAGLAPGGEALLSDPDRARADDFPLHARRRGLTCVAIPGRCRPIARAAAGDDQGNLREFEGRIFRVMRPT